MSANVVSFTTTGNALLSAVTGLQAKTDGLAIKLRFKGDLFAKATANSNQYSMCLVSCDGSNTNRKFYIYLNRATGTTQLTIQANPGGGGSAAKCANIDLANIVQTDYYVAYIHFKANNVKCIVYKDDGTVVAADNSTQFTSTMPTAAGNGTIKIANAGTYNTMAWTIDGLALYSDVLTGADQYSAPSASDANLLAGVTFDEGSGTSAANLKSGEAAFTLTNTTWTSAGLWDGGAAPTDIAKDSGDFQAAQVGTALPTPLRVLVTGAGAAPVAGYSVTFVVATGGGSLASSGTVSTDASGFATCPAWTLGASPGDNTVTVTDAALTGSPLTFTAFGTTAPVGGGGRRLIGGSLIQPLGRS